MQIGIMNFKSAFRQDESNRSPVRNCFLGQDHERSSTEKSGLTSLLFFTPTSIPVTLREPEKPSLGLYLDFNQQDAESIDLDRLLRFIRHYHTRSFHLHGLKSRGSEASHETRLWERGENAWSVLRNVHDRRSLDTRFDTIMEFMRQAFPTFDGVVFDQTGPSSVYAAFLEKGRRAEIKASGVSDGHLQLLLLLIALFSEGDTRSSVVLFDEPEISLHPWAIAVFAKAVNAAARDWNRQVLIATHSPVLISQFDPKEILAAEVTHGQTAVRRLSNIHEVDDLLQQYAAGSLYEAQLVGAQNPVPVE
jgi:predicted ATPase